MAEAEGEGPMGVLSRQEVLEPWSKWLKRSGNARTAKTVEGYVGHISQMMMEVALEDLENVGDGKVPVIGIANLEEYVVNHKFALASLAAGMGAVGYWRAWGLFWHWVRGERTGEGPTVLDQLEKMKERRKEEELAAAAAAAAAANMMEMDYAYEEERVAVGKRHVDSDGKPPPAAAVATFSSATAPATSASSFKRTASSFSSSFKPTPSSFSPFKPSAPASSSFKSTPPKAAVAPVKLPTPASSSSQHQLPSSSFLPMNASSNSHHDKMVFQSEKSSSTIMSSPMSSSSLSIAPATTNESTRSFTAVVPVKRKRGRPPTKGLKNGIASSSGSGDAAAAASLSSFSSSSTAAVCEKKRQTRTGGIKELLAQKKKAGTIICTKQVYRGGGGSVYDDDDDEDEDLRGGGGQRIFKWNAATHAALNRTYASEGGAQQEQNDIFAKVFSPILRQQFEAYLQNEGIGGKTLRRTYLKSASAIMYKCVGNLPFSLAVTEFQSTNDLKLYLEKNQKRVEAEITKGTMDITFAGDSLNIRKNAITQLTAFVNNSRPPTPQAVDTIEDGLPTMNGEKGAAGYSSASFSVVMKASGGGMMQGHHTATAAALLAFKGGDSSPSKAGRKAAAAAGRSLSATAAGSKHTSSSASSSPARPLLNTTACDGIDDEDDDEKEEGEYGLVPVVFGAFVTHMSNGPGHRINSHEATRLAGLMDGMVRQVQESNDLPPHSLGRKGLRELLATQGDALIALAHSKQIIGGKRALEKLAAFLGVYLDLSHHFGRSNSNSSSNMAGSAASHAAGSPSRRQKGKGGRPKSKLCC